MKRSRGNDGHHSGVAAVLPIAPGLLAALLAEFHEPREARAPRIFHGPKAFHGGQPATRLTDEQVITIRKMREWHGMSVKQIADALNESEASVYGITRYVTRVHLEPGPRPAPATPEPAKA